MPTPERVALYLRVSTEEQRDRQTVESQRERASEVLAREGVRPVAWYVDDGVSGKIPLAKRPDGARLLADAEAGRFDVLRVVRVDRLGRSTLEILRAVEALEARGVALQSITEPFETVTHAGKFILTMLAAAAQLEADNIRDRAVDGLHRRAREGRWNGGLQTPYGYRASPDGYLLMDAVESAVVGRMFHRYVHEGMGTIRLAADLTAEGVPIPRVSAEAVRIFQPAGHWRHSTVSRILRNPIYIGEYRYGKLRRVRVEGEYVRTERTAPEEQIPFLVQGFVDADLFHAAGHLLTRRRLWATRNAKRDYLLRGLIHCAHCGATFHGVTPTATGVSYYRHPTRPGMPCRGGQVRAAELETRLWERLRRLAADPDATVAELTAEIAAERAEARADAAEEERTVRAAWEDAERFRQNLVRRLLEERIGEADFDRERARVEERQAALAARLADLEARRQQGEEDAARLVGVREWLAAIQATAETADFAERRALVEMLVAGITADVDSPEARVVGGRFRIDFWLHPGGDCCANGTAFAEQSTVPRFREQVFVHL